jgi:hypothetical protein
MYDVATQTVSKLRGELSSVFVEVAESNANSQELDSLAAASDIVEQWKQSPFEVESEEEPLAASSDMYEDRVLPRKVVDISSPATNQELSYDEIKEKNKNPFQGYLVTGDSEPDSEAKNDKASNMVLVSSGYSKTSDFTGPAV